MANVKNCFKCNQQKELSEFNLCKKTKDGVQTKCRACEKKYRDLHKLQIKNRMKDYNGTYYSIDKRKEKNLKKYYDLALGLLQDNSQILENLKIYLNRSKIKAVSFE